MPSEAFEMRGLLCARTLPHLPHEPCTLQGTLRASTLFPSNAENFFKYCKVLATIIPIYGNVPNFPFQYLDFVHYVRACFDWKKTYISAPARKKTRANKDQEMLPGPDRSYYSRPNSGPTEGQRYMVEFIFLFSFYFHFNWTFAVYLNIRLSSHALS